MDWCGWCWPWVNVGLVHWWLRDWHGSAWVVLAVGDGFWSWVWVVLGLLANGLGLLAVGGVGVCFFLFFLFLVMVGLMSVGVVGFVINAGGFNGC